MAETESRRIEKTSRFAVMAQRPGGISREKALARAEESVENLKADYLEWVARDLRTLEKLINAMHEHEGGRDDDMEAAYTKTAQIRDLGGTFEFPLTTEVADGLCELIHRHWCAPKRTKASKRTTRSLFWTVLSVCWPNTRLFRMLTSATIGLFVRRSLVPSDSRRVESLRLPRPDVTCRRNRRYFRAYVMCCWLPTARCAWASRNPSMSISSTLFFAKPASTAI